MPVKRETIYDSKIEDEIDFEWVPYPRSLVNDTRSYLDKLALDKIDYHAFLF